MKRIAAIFFVAAAIGGFATHTALQFAAPIQSAEAAMDVAAGLAAASHGVGILSAPDSLDPATEQQAAQSSLSVLQQGAQ
ncbi:hypothetical protein HNQ50_003738 [Silvimonas terrae]|uniref:DUF4148 domain-containing protein n=1 Tax=Silvimonas terrae TaxID=300266 RepID=A0A840RK73_9NEIS|nr:hypothetical protein [Silvimonas terrae]MBB5192984.1 hypothetical protein [Silvimonas terrae]